MSDVSGSLISRTTSSGSEEASTDRYRGHEDDRSTNADERARDRGGALKRDREVDLETCDRSEHGRKTMTKTSLASVALLTEAEAARAFNMGTTRFKARCRTLGIARWPYRKLMSLKNLYYDLTVHLKRALDGNDVDMEERARAMMEEIKTYAALLESDLSLLNSFYNGKKAWPDHILKIRQTIYKKRHAEVLVNKKIAAKNAKSEQVAARAFSDASDFDSRDDDRLSDDDSMQTDRDGAGIEEYAHEWWQLALEEPNFAIA